MDHSCTTWAKEESKISEQKCSFCERFECKGECTIPEFKADVERIQNEVIHKTKDGNGSILSSESRLNFVLRST